MGWKHLILLFQGVFTWYGGHGLLWRTFGPLQNAWYRRSRWDWDKVCFVAAKLFCSKTHVDKRNPIGYAWYVIKSFKHKGLEDFFYTGDKKGIKTDHADRLSRILDRLNAASQIRDMNYPGSFLHQLSGNKKGLYAVKVSGNWRVFFKFIDGDAYIVDYDDYHWEV